MIRGSNPLVVAMIDRLQANLPAALAAQVAAYGDDVPLPVPRNYRDHVTQDEGEYPVVFVLAGRAGPQEQTGRWLTTIREIHVVPELRADSSQHLSLGLMRYEAAIIEAALGQHAPPPAHVLLYTGSEPSPVFMLQSDQGTDWQSWVEISFTMTLYEEDRTP